MLAKALTIATTHDDCKDDASAGIGGLLLEVMKTQKKHEQEMRTMHDQMHKMNETVVSKLSSIEELILKSNK